MYAMTIIVTHPNTRVCACRPALNTSTFFLIKYFLFTTLYLYRYTNYPSHNNLLFHNYLVHVIVRKHCFVAVSKPFIITCLTVASLGAGGTYFKTNGFQKTSPELCAPLIG